jgi:hypothetical protein
MRRNKQSAGNQAADEDSTHSMLANPSGDRDDRRS